MFAWNGCIRKKWTHTGEKTHRAEKIAGIRGKKPHVHRVIILKQMADHTFDPSIARVVILHPTDPEETRILLSLDYKQNGVGLRYSWKEIHQLFCRFEYNVCGRFLCRVEGKETHDR